MDLVSMAIRLAGFELRDSIGYAHDNGGAPLLAWCHGQGFPKGQGQLKPSWEPIIMARKPFPGTVAANVLAHGCGGLNIDQCRIPTDDKLGGGMVSMGRPKVSEGWDRPWMHDPAVTERKKQESSEKVKLAESLGRWPANLILDDAAARLLDEVSGELHSQDPRTRSRKTDKTNKLFGSPFHDSVGKGAGYGDVGGASRYFLVVKHDDDTGVTQVAQSDFSMYNTPVERGAICGQEKIKGVDTSVGKRTESNADSLNTDGYGNSITGLFHPDTISITKTATHSIMIFPILSASTSMNIGTCTIETESDISWLTALNIESVSDAGNGNFLMTTSDDQQVLIKATVKIANGQHSQNGASKTESITEPTHKNGDNETPNGYGTTQRNGAPNSPRFFLNVAADEDALRFAYVPKASKRDRSSDGVVNNIHPTCKPRQLMKWLCRLVCQPGGTILDPFLGSGSTGVAAVLEGFSFIGIELDEEYISLAEKRIAHAQAEECQATNAQLPLLATCPPEE
jgi:hypothetical protein